MPSTSPGPASASASPSTSASLPPPTSFAQILPGAPTPSLQSLATFIYRFKRYVAYISGSQLNIFTSSNALVYSLRFSHEHVLIAVAAENQTGKLVVASKKQLCILEPVTEGWSRTWWEKALFLRREDEGNEARWLSWGDVGEVLVAGTRVLTLFSTLPSSRTSSPAIHPVDGDAAEERRALWSKPTASPIRQAEFSPSASLIASCGNYDRLVKIWRRLSFEEGLFDHIYLPHPGAVTHLQWRPMEENTEERRGSGISGRHDDDLEVLYTIANDGVLRVWRTGGIHDLEILTLHTTVDLLAAIPQSPSLTVKDQSRPSTAPRYAVILPSDQFCAAINAAIGVAQSEKVSHSKELLKEMVSKEPDVIIAFDGQGRMSAWGLQSIGHKRRPETPTIDQAYHIAHAEGLALRLPSGTAATCSTWFQDDKLHLITHSLAEHGDVTWWQGAVETLFSSSAAGSDRLTCNSTWNGHSDAILNLQTCRGHVISTSSGAVSLWNTNQGLTMQPHMPLRADADVLAAIVLHGEHLLLTVLPSAFALWDLEGHCLAKVAYETAKPGTLHVLSNDTTTTTGMFIQHDSRNIACWTVEVHHSISPDQVQFNVKGVPLTGLSSSQALVAAVPVSMPFEPDRGCMIGLTKSGTIECYLVPDSTSKDGDFELFATFDTGIAEPGIFTGNVEFAALSSKDRGKLVILDLTDGYVEHQKHSKRPMNQLACFTPQQRHNFLAVGYDFTIDILAQGRYEHHSSDTPIWLSVKSVSISGCGLQIASVAWLPDGTLALAAGNGIFVTKPGMDTNQLDNETKETIDADPNQTKILHLPELTGLLKDPLPAWHPSFLSHLLRHGHHGIAASLLRTLAQKLKFWSTGEELSPMLDEQPELLVSESNTHDAWLDDDTVQDLKEQLEEKDLPRTSLAEQKRLRHVIDALVYLREHVNQLDRNALSYLLDWKMQLLFAADEQQLPNGEVKGAPSREHFVPEMHWREICFAYHSTTQQALLDILILHYDNKLTWPIARRLGVMAWLSDRDALEKVFEQLGQTAYRSEQPPNPVNASLHYLALHKKPTLLALWRIATWHKEQRSTMNFLKRDFNQPDARTAARKNAYALMGKRRFHYAAAFFLLAEDPASATSVLAGQCEDAPFAIAVARLYCGDGSSVLRKLLEDRVIPVAKKDGNRWLMSWSHCVTLERSKASEALVKPLTVVKMWQQDDPATLLLYQHLRNATSEHEYDAVLRATRILRRMGLWLLALDLVSRWQFKPVQTSLKSSKPVPNDLINGGQTGPPSLLDQYSTPAPPKEPPSLLDGFQTSEPAKQAPADDKAAREAKAAELLAKIKAKKQDPPANSVINEKKPEPTQFKEPDPNSLLDSFGF